MENVALIKEVHSNGTAVMKEAIERLKSWFPELNFKGIALERVPKDDIFVNRNIKCSGYPDAVITDEFLNLNTNKIESRLRTNVWNSSEKKGEYILDELDGAGNITDQVYLNQRLSGGPEAFTYEYDSFGNHIKRTIYSSWDKQVEELKGDKVLSKEVTPVSSANYHLKCKTIYHDDGSTTELIPFNKLENTRFKSEENILYEVNRNKDYEVQSLVRKVDGKETGSLEYSQFGQDAKTVKLTNDNGDILTFDLTFNNQRARAIKLENPNQGTILSVEYDDKGKVKNVAGNMVEEYKQMYQNEGRPDETFEAFVQRNIAGESPFFRIGDLYPIREWNYQKLPVKAESFNYNILYRQRYDKHNVNFNICAL